MPTCPACSRNVTAVKGNWCGLREGRAGAGRTGKVTGWMAQGLGYYRGMGFSGVQWGPPGSPTEKPRGQPPLSEL